MVTEVLWQKDLLAEEGRIPFAPLYRRGNPSGNGNGNGNLTNLVVNRKGSYTSRKKVFPKSNQKKSNTVTEAKRRISAEPRRKYGVPNSGLVIGQVTLLRRGELLDSVTSKTKGGDSESTPNQKLVDDLAVCEPDLIQPVSPLAGPKQINVRSPIDGYAGSAFYSSPSPRSVPLPSFFKKQQAHGKIKSWDDSAARDLRRMLRLDSLCI